MVSLISTAVVAFAAVASALTSASTECNSTVSAPIVATIDNGTYFSTCAEQDEGVSFNVSSLFDVLNFTSSDFVLFCNSSTCLEPVHEMLHSIPTDCLISYDGSDRNLSAEVTSLHTKCHQALGETEDDDGDDDDASMSMDMSGMDMSGMDLGGSSSSSSGGSNGATTTSTLVGALSAAAVAFAWLI